MQIRENVSLAPMTTMKIGGPARYFCEAVSLAEIEEAVAFAAQHELPIFILGGGSNILVSDDGYPGMVLHVAMNDVTSREEDEELFLTVGAGYRWDDLVALAVSRGVWGIENLSAIPGTVGGATVQNIGAYGCEVGDVITLVEVYDPTTSRVQTLNNAECRFSYRDSVWKHEGKGLIVLRVTFRLRRKATPNIAYKDVAAFFAQEGIITPTLGDICTAIIAIRSAKFPDLTTHGTAGSYFKNPVVSARDAEEFLSRFPDAPHYPLHNGSVKLSAAWIIDHVLHMRGVRAGHVGCWDAQALVVVNYGDASADEVRNFARDIQERSLLLAHIALETEVINVA
ncbi:MAG: UDP-N-acetylenolpyruvoylglucosamine reductase [Candidatus Lloydbacteria bacterium RIFCSPHIGHO2_01_FULL_49_22]|uniref:UDP-N-acetylenolpyruvoylglucosamine reductase n=1 Tax=Candidatus Lloydbacteria bacterium RIFCSPHIGHO2_01_FULL_49_22 TaxID=1798658 RepID=A0A1G2CWU9_9BACT|nr:MAG: UDP-N-acetylenolpyruvoylglucosamine reductase [Candidatus Lloydbacteria bacterium RIFCSPHIGHO2_01_FULL_49_22]OGZ08996.1 MAG: UDP-N-acetylenolpyruvoylglucosamine reductase [Candidatus Lloydbacteria bacterium RIFCSPHIGHO2_02_FULL_50_18]